MKPKSSKKKSRLDVTMSRINNGIVVTEYYRLDGILSSQKNRKFLAFLNEKYESGVLACVGNVLVDTKALNEKINLDCFNCAKLNPYGCCYSSPCALTAEESEFLLAHMADIVHGRFSEEEENHMIAYGVVDFNEDDNLVPLQHDHGCAFLMTTKEGYRLCAIKNWCIAHDEDIVGKCPSSCIMFPLDIMELTVNEEDTYYFVTSILDDDYAVPFSRWGVGTGSGFQCLGKGKVPDEYKGKIFKPEGFVPVYQEFSSLLNSWFGEETGKEICRICKGK